MLALYPEILRRVLKWEGGKVDHPKDPGGRTNQGITQKVYDRWRKAHGKPPRDVYLIDGDEVGAIYKRDYWDVLRGDRLPAGVDYSTFDAGVNSGPARAAKWLQKAVGAIPDGIVGNATIFAATTARDKVAVVRSICGYRLGFVRALKTWATFGRGWLRRITEVEAESVRMALEAGGASAAEIHRDAKAIEDAERKKANQHEGGAIASGAGTTAGGAATQMDPTQVDPAVISGIGIFVVVLIAAGLWFLYRAKVSRERERAFAALKAGGLK